MQPLSQRWIGRMMKSHRMALLLLTATLAVADDVTPLFDGRTLAGWSVIEFGGEGAVKVLPDGVLEIGAGTQLSGLVNTNPLRRIDYELSLEGRRVEGSDFFCGLTFPVHTNSCTLVLGGWGGSLVGISSINGNDASENETTQTCDFENGRWYKIRLKVTARRIEVWLDERQLIKLDHAEHRLGMRWGDIDRCVPLGLATWQTKGQLRNLTIRPVPPAPADE